jgi:hypothetical protein
MTKGKRTNDKYRQYNDKKKKDKWTGTDNTMTKRERTKRQGQTIQ